jgi:osmotically-inducible protein OsmY
MRSIAIFLILLSAVVNAQQKGPATQEHKRPAPVVQPKLSDAQIEKAIKAKFSNSKSAKDGFTVRVSGGTAYLDGKTDVIQHKGSATRMARTAGAAQVVNKIQVSDKAKQAAAANLAEGRRRVQVKRGDARTQR